MKVLIGSNSFGLEAVIEELEPRHPQIEFVHCPENGDIMKAVADADVYLGWLSRSVFLAAESLKWIQSPSSGVDRFLSIEELRRSDVILTSAGGTHGAALADHVFAMILAFTRQIRSFVVHQKEHRWSKRELRPLLRELTGSTLGIVGFGVVGGELAKRARGFDMRILAVDLLQKDRPEWVERLAPPEELDRLLEESDFVVVTVPYTEITRGLFDRRRLAKMRPSAMLVGVSRGEIIDETALAAALREGRLAAAALDVFGEEPLSGNSPLWDVPNLLLTPHAAGGTQFEAERILEIFVDNLERFLRNDLPLRNQVDKLRGF